MKILRDAAAVACDMFDFRNQQLPHSNFQLLSGLWNAWESHFCPINRLRIVSWLSFFLYISTYAPSRAFYLRRRRLIKPFIWWLIEKENATVTRINFIREWMPHLDSRERAESEKTSEAVARGSNLKSRISCPECFRFICVWVCVYCICSCVVCTFNSAFQWHPEINVRDWTIFLHAGG